MIFVPLSLMGDLTQSIMSAEIGTWYEPSGNIITTFLLLSYFFLLHHFYRADKDDATPDEEAGFEFVW